MQVIINIPDEFVADWNKDRFDDSLHRLSADAHLIAGNYEQETAKMLADAFKNAAQPDTDTVSRKAVLDAVQKIAPVEISEQPLYIDNDPLIMSSDVERILTNLPPLPSRSQEQRYGYWMRMSDLSESEDDRYKCSCCGNVVHHRDKVFLYTYNSWCGACGADMKSKDAHGAWRIHAIEGGAV